MVTKRADVRVEKRRAGRSISAAKAYYGANIQAQGSLAGERTEGASALDRCLLLVKKACAAANLECKRLDAPVARAIMQAADEAYGGQWRDQFVLEILSSGAGTALIST